MKKIDRKTVYDKCAGHCAYCGCVLSMEGMQVDHIHPKYRGGTDDSNNLNPACRVCNAWKKTYTIHEFRLEIECQYWRVRKASAGFRLMEKYGMVTVADSPGLFYFERMTP